MAPLKPSDEALILALACGSTVEAAAQKAGISSRTVYRRMEDKQFRNQIQEYRTDIVMRSTALLTVATMEAVKTLLNLLEQHHPAQTRLGSARAILEHGMKLREMMEIEQRLKNLENEIL